MYLKDKLRLMKEIDQHNAESIANGADHQITGVLIDAETGEARLCTVKDELESFYRILHCSRIDIVRRTVKGNWFSIVCDDEGLFNETPIVTALDINGDGMLVGSLFIAADDEENAGELRSLTVDEAEAVFDHIRHALIYGNREGALKRYSVLCDCEY